MRCEQASERKRRYRSRGQSDNDGFHSLRHDQPQHVHGLRTKRHAHTNFSGALLDRVSHRAVNSDRCQEQGRSGKDSQQPHHEPGLTERLRDNLVHRLGNSDRQPGIDRVERRLHHFSHRILS